MPRQQSWVCTACGTIAVFFSDSFESKTCVFSSGRGSPDCSTAAHAVRESRRLGYFTCKKANLPFGSQHGSVFYNITFADAFSFPLELQLFGAHLFSCLIWPWEAENAVERRQIENDWFLLSKWIEMKYKCSTCHSEFLELSMQWPSGPKALLLREISGNHPWFGYQASEDQGSSN